MSKTPAFHVEVLDLEFQRTPGLIASFLIFAPNGHFLIETGPDSCREALVAGLERHGLTPEAIDAVVLTHIHLDHAGGAGWWARQGTTVYVHEIGARHLIDPSKLLASATRIYGERMKPLWGEILAAPASRVEALEDGDRFEVGGLPVEALYTPGHARHHIAYRICDVAFVGDSLGIRGGTIPWLDLPAPPPEFDRELWQTSLERLRSEDLALIYRTHFGPRSDVAEEIDRIEGLIERSTRTIRELVEAGRGRAAIIEHFGRWMVDDIVARGHERALVEREVKLNPRYMSVDGILRYWAKRGVGPPGA